ncbi:MAG: ATP-binding cassette domain-containing protein [Candidatus Aminicenantia bacterium]
MIVAKIENLEKSFPRGFFLKRKKVLKEVNLYVNEGEVYGLLGPNGAGKTTTIKSLIGLVFPDSGYVEIFGSRSLDSKVRKKIGFLPEQPYFYEYLTAREYLNLCAELFGIKVDEKVRKIEKFSEILRMGNFLDSRLRTLSKGQLQRVGLAQALINEPSFIILDEPMSGLDPIGRKEVKDLILELKNTGKTILFSSHILQDAEIICDRVGIMLDGKIIEEGKLNELVSEKIHYIEIEFSISKPLPLPGEVISSGEKILIKVSDEYEADRAIKTILENGGKLISLIPKKATLEEIFVERVKEK